MAAAGGEDTDPSRAVRPWADRPHWWGVLGVLLGLLALLFALTDTGAHPASIAATSVRGDRVSGNYTGALDYPAVRTESFWHPVPAAGTELATLREPVAVPIRLTVACPGDRRTTVGTMQVGVRMGSGRGACLVTVSSASATPGPVQYRVSLHPVAP